MKEGADELGEDADFFNNPNPSSSAPAPAQGGGFDDFGKIASKHVMTGADDRITT